MKAADLRERSSEDLAELKATLKKDLFSYRMKNYTNQLDDTSLLRKARRDLARIEQILQERGRAPLAGEGGSAP
jgi:large subunit ribosomal protein L29